MESGIAASPMPWQSGEGGLKYPLGSHGSVKWHPAALQGQHAVHSHTWEEVDACDGNDCGGNPAGVAASSPLGNHFPLHLLGRASPIFGTQRTIYRRTGHTPATAVSAAVVLAAWRTCACAGVRARVRVHECVRCARAGRVWFLTNHLPCACTRASMNMHAQLTRCVRSLRRHCTMGWHTLWIREGTTGRR